jgi:RNA polymerase sigma-70 factor (ECF subfamily)
MEQSRGSRRKTAMEQKRLRVYGRPDFSRLSNAEIIRLAQTGSSHAFERLYQLHSRRVYRLSLRMAGNPAEAEDVVQDVFFKLFRKIHTLRGESSFSTWPHRLTVNIVLMRSRKKRYPEVSLDATTVPGEQNSRPLFELGGPDLRVSGCLIGSI